jgi:hypothetical protein
MYLNEITEGFYEKRTAVTARYPSDDTTKEQVKMFSLSQITKGKDTQTLPALD